MFQKAGRGQHSWIRLLIVVVVVENGSGRIVENRLLQGIHDVFKTALSFLQQGAFRREGRHLTHVRVHAIVHPGNAANGADIVIVVVACRSRRSIGHLVSRT